MIRCVSMMIVSTCHGTTWAAILAPEACVSWNICCAQLNWKQAYHHCKSGSIGTSPDASPARPSPLDPVGSSISDAMSCSSILACFLRLARYCLTSSTVAQLFLKRLRYGWRFLAYGIALVLVPVSPNAKKLTTSNILARSRVLCWWYVLCKSRPPSWQRARTVCWAGKCVTVFTKLGKSQVTYLNIEVCLPFVLQFHLIN